MAHNGYRVMDSDMHVMEPPDLWQRYIEPRFRGRAPVGTTNYLADLHLAHDGEVISRFKRPMEGEDKVLAQYFYGPTQYADATGITRSTTRFGRSARSKDSRSAFMRERPASFRLQ